MNQYLVNICLKKLSELKYPDNMWRTPIGCNQYACEYITRTSQEQSQMNILNIHWKKR